MRILNKVIQVLFICALSIQGGHAYSYIFQYQYDAAGNRIGRTIVQPQQPQNSPRMMGHSGDVTVSPTVTTDYVTISTTLDPEQTHMCHVLSNLQGCVLAASDIVSQQTTISLGLYPCGIYLLTVKTDESVETFKIIRE